MVLYMMMKPLLSFALVAWLATSASVIAFAPGMITSATLAPNSIRMDTENGMVRRDKPAKSQEEDLELTRAIIMKHISFTDKMVSSYDEDEDDDEDVIHNISTKAKAVVVEDNDDVKTDDVVFSPSSSNLELVGAADGGDSHTIQRLDKIKSFGIKIKDELMSRLEKVKDEDIAHSTSPSDGDEQRYNARQRLSRIKTFGTQVKDEVKSRFGRAREDVVAIQPLKNIKSFGTKIKDDLKSRLGKDE